MSLNAWQYRFEYLDDCRIKLMDNKMARRPGAPVHDDFEISSRFQREVNGCESRASGCLQYMTHIQKVKTRALERQTTLTSATRADLLAGITRFITIAGDNNDVERLLMHPDI